MSDLEVGDMVYTGTNSKGAAQYEPIYAFGYTHAKTRTEYLRLHSKEDAIEISPDHLIYLANTDDEPIRADAVRVGDQLLKGSTSEESVPVTKIERMIRHGAYQPLTPSGFLVVNDIVASAYLSIQEDTPKIVDLFEGFFSTSEQKLFHWWLAPYRTICLGVSSELCVYDAYLLGKRNEEGILYWLLVGLRLAEIGEQQHWIVQWIGIFLVASMLGIFIIAETFFDCRWISATMLVVCIVMCVKAASQKKE